MWLALGTDLTRNNDFAYGPTDELGLRCFCFVRTVKSRDDLLCKRYLRIARVRSDLRLAVFDRQIGQQRMDRVS